MKRMRSLKEHIMLPFGMAVTAGAFAAVAVLLLTSLVLFVLQLPADWGYIMGLLSLSVGCFTAGYVLGRKKRRSGIKQGALCGTAMFLLCLIGGVFFGSVTLGGALAKLAVCMIAGITGGVSGVNGRSNG